MCQLTKSVKRLFSYVFVFPYCIYMFIHAAHLLIYFLVAYAVIVTVKFWSAVTNLFVMEVQLGLVIPILIGFQYVTH